MKRAIPVVLLLATAAVLWPGGPYRAGDVETGAIRLAPRSASPESDATSERVRIEEPRRGFDYDSFETRLESLWFQRKTLLADGRDRDANQQLEQIRAFCAEEGVQRLERLAGALIAEARRYTDEGNYERALNALRYAEAFDPGRPQVPLGRAAAHWKAEHGKLAVVLELVDGMQRALAWSVRDLTLFHQLAYVAVLALAACLVIFSVVMLARYQVPFRHEIEEWAHQFCDDPWPRLLGWFVLALPILVWLGVGWVALYWVVVTFRFMHRGERLTATVLLAATLLGVPAYRVAVALYATSADPAVRTTLASVGGEYDPDRIVRLRQLVERHPDDAVYRFLLAGLYKNGRYFEEAFHEYKSALERDPRMAEAHINVGNVFYITGQYAEAVANYRRAIDIDRAAFLAYFNMHLAQSEAFRFAAAEQSLARARDLDADRVAELLSGTGKQGDRPMARDATLDLGSVWETALAGRRPHGLLSAPSAASAIRAGLGQLLNPVGLVALAALIACGAALLSTRAHAPAKRCVRCGRPFCHHCKSSREGHEYCSQCVHLYVLGDGLAPGSKSKKMFEVERHERLTRRARKLLSLFVPGTAQLLRGRAGRGCLLILLWCAALFAWQPVLLVPFEWWAGVDLRLDLLVSTEVPPYFVLRPLAVLAAIVLPALWLVGNVWRWNRREV